jgi:uncharacterized repeat protein (TIGR02543 family)
MTKKNIFSTAAGTLRSLLVAFCLMLTLPVHAVNNVNDIEINLTTLDAVGTNSDDWNFDGFVLSFNAGASGKTYNISGGRHPDQLSINVSNSVTTGITFKFDGIVGFPVRNTALIVNTTAPVTLTGGANLIMICTADSDNLIEVYASGAQIIVAGGLKITTYNNSIGVNPIMLGADNTLTVEEGSSLTSAGVLSSGMLVNNGTTNLNGISGSSSTVINNGSLWINGNASNITNNEGGKVVVYGDVTGTSSNHENNAADAFQAKSVANHTPLGHYWNGTGNPSDVNISINLSQPLSSNEYYSVDGNDITALKEANFTITGTNAEATFTKAFSSYTVPITLNNATLNGLSMAGYWVKISGDNSIGAGGVTLTKGSYGSIHLTGFGSLTVGANGNTDDIPFDAGIGDVAYNGAILGAPTVTINGNVDHIIIWSGSLTVNGNMRQYLIPIGGETVVNGYVASIEGGTWTGGGTVSVTYHDSDPMKKTNVFVVNEAKITLIGNRSTASIYQRTTTPDLAIDFDAQGGSIVSGIYVYNSNTWTGTIDWATPTKKGFYFAGWYTDRECTPENEVTSFPVEFTQSIIYYAKWSDVYTVSFAGEEIDIAPQIIEDGNLATCPEDLTRAGYNFDGWFTDNDTFLDEWDFETDVVTQDVILYAKWDETVGIAEIKSASVKIYPNPVKDGLFVINNGQLIINNVEIVDLSGRIVGAYPCGRPNATINVSMLPQGFYFVRIETDKGIVTEKFVKE